MKLTFFKFFDNEHKFKNHLINRSNNIYNFIHNIVFFTMIFSTMVRAF